MSKLSPFETSIIGFFVGIIVAAYLTFITSTPHYIGNIIQWISLTPLLKYFTIPDSYYLLYLYIFTVCVFTIYGLAIGLFLKFFNKPKIILAITFLILVTASFEQYIGMKNFVLIQPEHSYSSALSLKALPKENKKYFGIEDYGDLNNDGDPDIAFVINRNFKDGNIVSYLASALTNESGKDGTNLIYIGEKISITKLEIHEGIVEIVYMNENSTSTQSFFARVTDGKLEEIVNE